jgi:hypothetical protein
MVLQLKGESCQLCGKFGGNVANQAAGAREGLAYSKTIVVSFRKIF